MAWGRPWVNQAITAVDLRTPMLRMAQTTQQLQVAPAHLLLCIFRIDSRIKRDHTAAIVTEPRISARHARSIAASKPFDSLLAIVNFPSPTAGGLL